MTDLPASEQKIQVEECAYRGPVSENVMSRLGASVNAILDVLVPVGSVVASMLTEAQFQTQSGPGWVLADGRSANGTRYKDITGQANIPDFRGLTLRGKNNGRVDGKQNPDGDLALGAYQADMYASHTHPGSWLHFQSGMGVQADSGAEVQQVGMGAAGGNETRGKNATINWMFRID